MKKFILFLFWSGMLLVADGQDTCGYNDPCHRVKLSGDIKTMYGYIETLNTTALLPLDSFFRNWQNQPSSPKAITELKKSAARADTLIKIYNDKLNKNPFYLGNFTGCPVEENTSDTSYFYYFTHTELDDYKYSLTSISEELRYMSQATEGIDVFYAGGFLNAYYYMCQSRSVLMATMDNLIHYERAVDDAKHISRTTDLLPGEFTITRTDIGQQTAAVTKQVNEGVMQAREAILQDRRKNWWWQTLIGGVAGGLIAGLIVHSAK
ncbi:MAG TPA: hypothetical protein VF974_07745 [Patescibacteria group bacterium]